MSQLLSPVTIQNMTLKNRIVMSPMCMYSCVQQDGKVTNWHRTHYTTRAVGGVGLIIVEASAVTPQGRISPQDLGIWDDGHIQGLQESVHLVHEQGAKIGIQLAHAGRKAELDSPSIAPSAIPFDDNSKTPESMTTAQIKDTVRSFQAAARRAKEAGFDCIEIHGAHGYLINEFLTPLCNRRSDDYGGSEENRTRFLKEVLSAVKAEWSGPLFVRISASDYHPEGNDIDVYVRLAKQLKQAGVDLVDCSSGGVVPAPISVFPGYQVPFAEKIRREADIRTAAVGLITDGRQAEEIVQNGRADLVLLARALLRDPYWPRTAAEVLGDREHLDAPKQYGRAW